MTYDIIGAGIGGLSTAIALQQKGITTQIFEQADELKPLGAGIIMANNAMQVYDKLGLRGAIEHRGNPISAMNITDLQLRPISTVNLKYFEDKYGVQNIAIHRGKLQQLLASKLKGDHLNLGHTLDIMERTSSGFNLKFKNGKELHSNVVIGADGLNSAVRNQLFQDSQVRNTGQICWRGVTEYSLPKKYQHQLNEAWGKGDRFGFVKIDAKKVYWYAVKSFSNEQKYSSHKIKSYFEDYHPIIKDLLQQTPKNTIHTAILQDLKPIGKWWQQDVCLIGDAAHAATPNLGQGACQAIEDAYILSACLDKYERNTAFAKFQRIRMPKAKQVVKTSWTIGKLAHWEKPLAIKLRNALLKLSPEKINRKQSEKIFKLETV